MTEKTMQVPAREVPFPGSVSEAARAGLAMWAAMPSSPSPSHTDKQGWRDRVAAGQAAMMPMLQARIGDGVERLDIAEQDLGGAKAFVLKDRTVDAGDRVVLDIHGGGLTSGHGEVCRMYGAATALDFPALVYSVDYRMPPDHPYPAALDDCMAAWRTIVERHDPRNVVVRGVSAGGNLAAALALRARDEGLPAPAALVLLTPEIDLTESGDSFITNTHFDVVLKGSLMEANLLYAGGHDLADPYLSPLFGDFTKGFPPCLITVGTRDLFLSNGVRLHNASRRTGNRSELIVEEAMPHGGFMGAPEDALLTRDVIDYAMRAWSGFATA